MINGRTKGDENGKITFISGIGYRYFYNCLEYCNYILIFHKNSFSVEYCKKCGSLKQNSRRY